MKQIRMHRSLVPDDLDIKDILETKIVSNSKYVRELESELCKVHNCKYALCFGSATSATALVFSNVSTKVYMPSFTWSSTKETLRILKIPIGYLPINKITWVVDKEVQEDIDNTSILYLTTTFGKIPEISYPHRTVIDGAASTGFFDMKKHKCLALITSFSPSKTITGIEGGAVMTDNRKLYLRLKAIQSIMSRMGEINAKIALENLKNRDKMRNWKKFLYQTYREELPFAQFQEYDEEHSLNEIAIVLPFNRRQWDLLEDKIEVRKRYNPNYGGHKEDKKSVASKVYKNIVTLPSYPDCDYEEVIKIIKTIRRLK